MPNHRLAVASLGLLTLAADPAPAQTTVIPLNPRGTFLRTNGDSVVGPAVRTLASLGLAPGDRIRIHILGSYTQDAANTVTRDSVALFSSSDTLLAPTGTVQRVPGAIDAGEDFATANTFMGGLPTDIPQDFRLANPAGPLDPEVVVPAGATHLFLCAYDTYYTDNRDTDGDFAAEVTLICVQNRCCGTSDFNGDGDFGTDQDIEAFFACLAGNCCAACFEGGADFNGDGDFGTDADIEAFFRVLSGGGC
jgi:hypothetical protein